MDEDVDSLRTSLEEEKAQWQAEMEKTESRHQRHIQTLQAQLTEAAQHRANLESTKNALESTIEMMSMQSADRTASGDVDGGHAQSIEQAIQEERRRARQENDRLQQRLDEMRNQLEAAERRASSAVTGDTWAEEMNSVRRAME